MRNAGNIITVAAVGAALVACSPPSEQPSDLPPGAEPSTTTRPPQQSAGSPERTGTSGTGHPTGTSGTGHPTGQQGEPCTAEDITVAEPGTAGGEGPRVTIPDGCAAPTELLTRELDEGMGAGVEPGGLVEFDYTMTGWSSGKAEEGTFGESATMTVRFGEQHQFDGWEEALTDIREQGRRLIVVPADRGYGSGSGHPLADEPIVLVTEVVRVVAPE